MGTLKDKLVIFFAGSRLPRDFVVDHLARYLEEWLLSREGEEYLKSLGYQRQTTP
ncbi:MAG: hypothetical protein HY347_09705 [candidate division NC10 bacterium]|nr:hypothetical protein [candidate division NC10 bacterium]